MPPKLGILAGGGQLPVSIIEQCRADGRDCFIVAFKGQTPEATVEGTPHAWVRLGAGGAAVRRLREAHVQDLVMAGSIRRPSLAALRPDAWGLRFFLRSGTALLGDNALLSALAKALEEEGFRIVGADSLVPDLLAAPGVWGRVQPDEDARRDMAVALAAARRIGVADRGQAAVARGGQVIGLEGREGTDALLVRRVAPLARGRAGVLVKAKKPDQERRVDLPTIGISTVEHAARAGLAGIAVEAGSSFVLDRAGVVKAADAAGLFVMGIADGGADGSPAAGRPGPLIFLVAGEPSGDALGAGLMERLKRETGGRVRFAGVGGERMAEAGLETLFPMADLTVMGALEVVPRLPKLMARIRETVARARALKPDAVVTIDSPDFSFRVGARLKGEGMPLIHYVAPSVWAWRPKRARKIAGFLDHLLALLPFEPPYFEREGLGCTFVGHPVVESGADRGDRRAFRRRHGLAADVPLLAVLPGSRRTEVSRLLPVFADALQRLAAARPGLRAVVATGGAVAAEVKAAAAGWAVPAVVVEEGEKYDAFAAADVALACSGTVALELAMAGTPAVIAYRMNWISAWIAKRLVRVRYVNIVNLVLDRPAVPELLLDQCTPKRLAGAVGELFDDPAKRAAQRVAAKEALARLGQGGSSPNARAAETVLKVIEERARRRAYA